MSSFDEILGRQAAEQAEEYARLMVDAPTGFEPLTLVPVEVFGTDGCCNPEHADIDCASKGYGLSDAVSCLVGLQPRVIELEVVDVELGLWCSDCSLPSGVRAWFTMTMTGATTTTLRSTTRCHDCSGTNVGVSP